MRWSYDDLQALLAMRKDGKTWQQIGEHFHRPANACYQKWYAYACENNRAGGLQRLSDDGKRELRQMIRYLHKYYGSYQKVDKAIEVSHTTLSDVVNCKQKDVSKPFYKKIVAEYHKLKRAETTLWPNAGGLLKKTER